MAEGTKRRSPLQSPRLAEIVAGRLRDRILSGELKDGESLPRQEDLVVEFQVSLVSIREALRILESEGMVTVLRGNVGGAVVHAAPVRTAASTIAMVLQSRNVDLEDVAVALQELEPVCAAMCARRPDRLETVVLKLRHIHEETVRAAPDVTLVSHYARRFHEAIVEGCGSETMIVLVGALETIWSAHAADLAVRATHPGELPERDDLFSEEALRHYAQAHEDLLHAIEKGDAELASRVAAEHMRVAAEPSSVSDRPILASLVRSDTRPQSAPSTSSQRT